MRQPLLYIIFCFMCLHLQAQQEFHVTTNGKATGNGTLENPWDLQTALSQKPEVVNGDDTIWLHEGIYNGRYLSTIKSTKDNRFITVAPYNNGKVILNGNGAFDNSAVLNVRGQQVIYKDFEITWLGNFSRDANDKDFQISGGVDHTGGKNCRFYNLIIHDTPGLGFGSWKHTGGTIIENCMIYNNGYMSKGGKGRGEGIYVQNMGKDFRIIKNNIIYSNYYKGIEVWSASKRPIENYVQNITVQGNLIFNSGLPSKIIKDNIIVATNDRNGINLAKNIQLVDNVLYHNTNFNAEKVNGNTPSLTLGYNKNSPIENVVVKNNIIIGRDNALRLFYIKSVTFRNNIVFSKFLQINSSQLENSKKWNFKSNSYFTEKENPFRISKTKEYNKEAWDSEFKLDINSEWKKTKEYELEPVLRIMQHANKLNTYNLALFSKSGNNVEVDFSEYQLSTGSFYKIYDVENRNKILVSGVVNATKKIIFSMKSTEFEKPLHNDISRKTLSNFGVFMIEFTDKETTSAEELSNFQKILKWLGF